MCLPICPIISIFLKFIRYFGIFLPPLLNPRELGGIIMSEISSLRNDILQIKMGLKLLTACCSFANCCAMYSGLYQPVCQWFYQFFFFYKINNRAQTAVFVKLFNHISKATISLLLQWTSRKVEISFLKSLFKFLGNPFSSCALSSWSYWPVRFFVKMQYVINFSGLCRC